MNNEKELVKQIDHLIDEVMEENVAFQGISVGTEIATSLYSKFKDKKRKFNDQELIASATSFQYIAKNLFTHIAKNKMEQTFLTAGEYVVVIDMVKDVSAVMLLDRKLAEMEGISKYQKILKDLILKISAFVETLGYIREDPFVKIMRAVPSADFLGVISKEGLPLKIIDNGNVQAPMVGSQISAMSSLSQVMLKEPLDYTIVQGVGAIVLIVQFDMDRILAVSIPENEKENLGKYLARIKEIIKEHDESGIEFQL